MCVLFTSHVSGPIHLLVCPSVCALAAELLDLKDGITIQLHNMSYEFEIKVVGQRSRSQRSKLLNFSFSAYYQKMGSIFKVTRSRSKVKVRRSNFFRGHDYC